MVTKNTDFWLNESELKTPIHDKMVLWTFANAKKIWEELKINFPYEDYNPELKRQPSLIKTIEFPIKGYNGFNLGYIDLALIISLDGASFLGGKYGEDDQRRMICFEIKPEVKSIGEVLRQFQYYKSNLPPSTKLVLLTKTIGLKELFESQGFYVYEYKGEKTI